ncbi:hypothetical protein M2437_000803 [Methylorubrum pseudosasae]|nr:hypothetical protein [Methylorubrum pseudosasae]
MQRPLPRLGLGARFGDRLGKGEFQDDIPGLVGGRRGSL